MRSLDSIPAAAAGIDSAAPDDVPGPEDSRDTDATRANAAIDVQPAGTHCYSIGPEGNPAETIARTPLKGINASHDDGRHLDCNLDLTPMKAQTDRGPREPVTLTDQASGRSVNSFLRHFPRSLAKHRCERQTALLVSTSDYNSARFRIKPTSRSTQRPLVRTRPQNWYRSKPLLTPWAGKQRNDRMIPTSIPFPVRNLPQEKLPTKPKSARGGVWGRRDLR